MKYNELIKEMKARNFYKFYTEYEKMESIYNYYNLAFESVLYELYYSDSYNESNNFMNDELSKIIKLLNGLTNKIRIILKEMDSKIPYIERKLKTNFRRNIYYYKDEYHKIEKEKLDKNEFLRYYKYRLEEIEHNIEVLERAKILKRQFLNMQVKIDGLARDYNKYLDDKKEYKTVDEYINENTSLAHFVFTNNTKDYKFSGIDGFLFNCQLHKEKTPSLRVLNKGQKIRCFGCGFSNDDFDDETTCASIGYLMVMEDITKEEAISLINEVYELNISDRICLRKDLVQKYRESLLSEEYKNLLLSSLNRMMNMYPSLDAQNHISYLQKQLDIIAKIKAGNYQMKYKE